MNIISLVSMCSNFNYNTKFYAHYVKTGNSEFIGKANNLPTQISHSDIIHVEGICYNPRSNSFEVAYVSLKEEENDH